VGPTIRDATLQEGIQLLGTPIDRVSSRRKGGGAPSRLALQLEATKSYGPSPTSAKSVKLLGQQRQQAVGGERVEIVG
jgi:hypothetical protein